MTMPREHATRLLWETCGVILEISAGPWIGLDEMVPHLPPGQRCCPPRPARVQYVLAGQLDDIVLLRNGRCIYRSRSRSLVLDALRTDTAWSVAVSCVRATFVHAGAVEIDGVGVLLPGPSGAGKSTLVAQLVASGATYLSDEYGVIDDHGRLWPFPCRPRLKGSSTTGITAERLLERASTAQHPLSVGVLIFPRYHGGSCFDTRAIPPGQAMLHLLPHMPAARLRPQQSMAAARQAVEHARCATMSYPAGREAADAIVGDVTMVRSHGTNGVIKA